MVKTLRESKAKLSELVNRAAGGEDVLITVRGQVRARLTTPLPLAHPIDAVTWMNELRELDRTCSHGGSGFSANVILEELRADRF